MGQIAALLNVGHCRVGT